MKKAIFVTLLCCALALCGCAKKEKNNTAPDDSNVIYVSDTSQKPLQNQLIERKASSEVSAPDGSISFGNYELSTKSKQDDFKHEGDIYKVKTFKEITKLERDGMFVYESVPGTSVHDFQATDEGVSFTVCGPEDAQITVGVKEDTEYEITVGGKSTGKVKSNLGGKLNLSVELAGNGDVPVVIRL